MRQVLKLHPDSRCNAVTEIEVEVARPGPGALRLRYLVTGKIDGLRLPAVTAPGRGDGLWRQTCFEAFVCAAPGAGYYEFNFSPSRQWAAYGFSGYRSGMTALHQIGAPGIEVRAGADYELQVSLLLDRLPGLPRDGDWHLGLSAVIEETDGAKSYWALAHPPGQADFHHADCFALELPVAVPG